MITLFATLDLREWRIITKISEAIFDSFHSLCCFSFLITKLIPAFCIVFFRWRSFGYSSIYFLAETAESTEPRPIQQMSGFGEPVAKFSMWFTSWRRNRLLVLAACGDALPMTDEQRWASLLSFWILVVAWPMKISIIATRKFLWRDNLQNGGG